MNMKKIKEDMVQIIQAKSTKLPKNWARTASHNAVTYLGVTAHLTKDVLVLAKKLVQLDISIRTAR